jgi:DNA repair protein RadA
MELERISCMTKELADELKKNGIVSVESLAIRSLSEIHEMFKEGKILEKADTVSFERAKKALEEAWRLSGFWIMKASEIETVRGKRLCFTTGSRAVDEMLGGGIFSREVTEFCGEYGSGKTEFLFTILVEALGRSKEISAIFIDTEETFSEVRVSEIAKARGYDPRDILERTIYIPANDSDFLLEIIDRLHLTIEARNVKLILIDSIIAVLRAEFVGRDVLWYRQQLLNRMLRRLLNLAKVYNIAVVVTNQVVANPQAQYVYDPLQQKVPTGGTVLGHNANTRLYLKKPAGGTRKRIVHLFDSNWRPEGERTIQLTEKGVEDV